MRRDEERDLLRLERLSLQEEKLKDKGSADSCSSSFGRRAVGVVALRNTATPTQTRVTLTDENIFINPLSSFLPWSFSVVHTCRPREEGGGMRLGVDEEGCPPGVDSLRTPVLSP